MPRSVIAIRSDLNGAGPVHAEPGLVKRSWSCSNGGVLFMRSRSRSYGAGPVHTEPGLALLTRRWETSFSTLQHLPACHTGRAQRPRQILLLIPVPHHRVQ